MEASMSWRKPAESWRLSPQRKVKWLGRSKWAAEVAVVGAVDSVAAVLVAAKVEGGVEGRATVSRADQGRARDEEQARPNKAHDKARRAMRWRSRSRGADAANAAVAN